MAYIDKTVNITPVAIIYDPEKEQNGAVVYEGAIINGDEAILKESYGRIGNSQILHFSVNRLVDFVDQHNDSQYMWEELDQTYWKIVVGKKCTWEPRINKIVKRDNFNLLKEAKQLNELEGFNLRSRLGEI